MPGLPNKEMIAKASAKYSILSDFLCFASVHRMNLSGNVINTVKILHIIFIQKYKERNDKMISDNIHDMDLEEAFNSGPFFHY